MALGMLTKNEFLRLYIESCPGEALDIFNHQHRSLTFNHTITNNHPYVNLDISSCSDAVAQLSEFIIMIHAAIWACRYVSNKLDVQLEELTEFCLAGIRCTSFQINRNLSISSLGYSSLLPPQLRGPPTRG